MRLPKISLGLLIITAAVFASSWGPDRSTNECRAADIELFQLRWPEFRGPQANGIETENTGPTPTHWSEDENIAWKIPTEGAGWSTPAVWDGLAWFTSASEDGSLMWAEAVQLQDGKRLWRTDLFRNEKVDEKHVMNSFASPSPVTDGQHVWVHFGSYGTACLEAATGKVVWERHDLPCNHWRGPGSSPVLFDGKLIVHLDGFDFQYVVALNAVTGETAWKVDRQIDYGTDNGDFFKAFCTPLVIDVDGEMQLISPTSKATLAYDPRTGEELWRITYGEFSATARPLWDGTNVYINTGFGKATMVAVNPRGSGDLTKTQMRWINETSVGSKSSQLLFDGLIYNVHDMGVATCIEAETGETLWKERLGGMFSASVMMAGGNLYFFDHDGTSHIVKPGREFQKVAENKLDDGCMASPVPLGSHLLIRTRTALYLIGPPL